MATLEEQILNKCEHFTGMMQKECKLGIKYEDVRVPDHKPKLIPCFKSGMFAGGKCDKCSFPSPEQAKQQAEEIEKSGQAAIISIVSVKNHIKNTGELNGELKCPACGGQLQYTSVELNGHVRIACKCGLSLME